MNGSTQDSSGNGGHDLDAKMRLRKELKEWERVFEKEKGHKPSAADVKSDPHINAKYKLYHRLFRTKSASQLKKSQEIVSYVSSAKVLKQATPRKRCAAPSHDTPAKTPLKLEEIEAIGPTPQANGRMLGLFDGISDQTPSRSKGASRRNFDHKTLNVPPDENVTPKKRCVTDFFDSNSPAQETPTKSTPTERSRYSTPVTFRSSGSNQHGFATPSFLRPTAQAVQSPQSPSLVWGPFPGKVKSLSALINDFKSNRTVIPEEVAYEQWRDEDDVELNSSPRSVISVPEYASRMKKGAKRTHRRVISSPPTMTDLMTVRPAPSLEIPASDDEAQDSQTSIAPTRPLQCSREPDPKSSNNGDSPSPEDEEPSDLDDINDRKSNTSSSETHQTQGNKKPRRINVKGGLSIGNQVSKNFISYKIRSRGGRRYGSGRFSRR